MDINTQWEHGVHLFSSYFVLTNGKTRAMLQKKKPKPNLKVVEFSSLKAHKHTVQPLGTSLKLSFDMIEFSYA